MELLITRMTWFQRVIINSKKMISFDIIILQQSIKNHNILFVTRYNETIVAIR